jgi:hypothetical protein
MGRPAIRRALIGFLVAATCGVVLFYSLDRNRQSLHPPALPPSPIDSPAAAPATSGHAGGTQGALPRPRRRGIRRGPRRRAPSAARANEVLAPTQNPNL